MSMNKEVQSALQKVVTAFKNRKPLDLKAVPSGKNQVTNFIVKMEDPYTPAISITSYHLGISAYHRQTAFIVTIFPERWGNGMGYNPIAGRINLPQSQLPLKPWEVAEFLRSSIPQVRLKPDVQQAVQSHRV